MHILTASQMGDVDRLTTQLYRIPSLLLMENAGRAVADELAKACPGLERKRVVIFCGKGNNGGDGLVVARYLALRGGRPRILLLAEPSVLRGDALANWEIAHALGLDMNHSIPAREAVRLAARDPAPDIVVDAIFGTGLSKPLRGDYRALVQWINGLADRALVASVDMPSGLFADSCEVPGAAVKAHLTVTFTAPKPALVLHPAAALAGRLVVAPIGSPSCLVENPKHRLALIDPVQVCRALPGRRLDSHKGHYGHVFALAGSRGKSGAALMTGLAALRAGAGLVTLWLPESLHRDVVGRIPEIMTEWIPETDRGAADKSAAERLLGGLHEAHCLVVGPGLTTQPSTQSVVRELTRRATVPLVLDADGLNAFSGKASLMRNDAGMPVIITPHPGEMARLAGATIARVQKNRPRTAVEFAIRHGCFVILKGFQTLIASPLGDLWVNPTGNPGMATGGSGDILAGLVGRFVAGWFRKYRGADRAALADHLAAAVYLHGRAADLAAAQLGEESLIATDILPRLPEAFLQVGRDAAKA